MTPDYSRLLDAALGASIRVEFGTDRPTVANYLAVLVVDEMHRYTRGVGKEPAGFSTPVALVRECVRRCAGSRHPTKR